MTPDPARQRLIVINLVRIVGVALVLFALLVIAGRFNLPREAGYLLGAAGLFEALVAPLLLARRWRSPRE